MIIIYFDNNMIYLFMDLDDLDSDITGIIN